MPEPARGRAAEELHAAVLAPAVQGRGPRAGALLDLLLPGRGLRTVPSRRTNLHPPYPPARGRAGSTRNLPLVTDRGAQGLVRPALRPHPLIAHSNRYSVPRRPGPQDAPASEDRKRCFCLSPQTHVARTRPAITERSISSHTSLTSNGQPFSRLTILRTPQLQPT